MMKSRIVPAVSISVLMGILASSSALAGGGPTGDKATYEAKCAVCHGKDGSGTTPQGKKLNLRDLRSAEVQNQSDDQLFTITAKGKEKMPAYEKKLTAEQMRAVVAYIRELAQ
jgi:mono/diheme cytochrome c family protein